MDAFGLGEFFIIFINFLLILFAVSVPVAIIILLVRIYRKTQAIEELLKKDE